MPECVAALRATPMRKGEGALGRMALTGEPVEIRDIRDEAAYQSRVRDLLVHAGFRSLLAVPLYLLYEIGLIVMRLSYKKRATPTA